MEKKGEMAKKIESSTSQGVTVLELEGFAGKALSLPTLTNYVSRRMNLNNEEAKQAVDNSLLYGVGLHNDYVYLIGAPNDMAAGKKRKNAAAAATVPAPAPAPEASKPSVNVAADETELKSSTVK